MTDSAYWQKTILEQLAIRGATVDQLHQSNTFAAFALTTLVEQGYVEGWGPEWDTALFNITAKGRDYLKGLQGN